MSNQNETLALYCGLVHINRYGYGCVARLVLEILRRGLEENQKIVSSCELGHTRLPS